MGDKTHPIILMSGHSNDICRYAFFLESNDTVAQKPLLPWYAHVGNRMPPAGCMCLAAPRMVILIHVRYPCPAAGHIMMVSAGICRHLTLEPLVTRRRKGQKGVSEEVDDNDGEEWGSSGPPAGKSRCAYAALQAPSSTPCAIIAGMHARWQHVQGISS